MSILNVILNHLKQKSTWAGLGTILALVGVQLDPEQLTSIGTAVIGLIGVYEVFRHEHR
jgi:hypothetical protein